MIIVLRLPLRFRAEFESAINAWLRDPKSAWVAEFGGVDLVKRPIAKGWIASPERAVDEEKLKAWQ